MSSSGPLRNPDPPRTFQLDPEAKQAIGKLSPELVWEQVKIMVQQAIQQYPQESEALRLKANFPVDLVNLMEVLGVMNPIRGVNQLHYANENLPLTKIPKLPLTEVLQAVLKFLTDSDRYQALEP